MILVKDVMSGNVRTISSSATIIEAAKAMRRWRVGSLIIFSGRKPVGIITEGDILKCVARGVNPRSTRLTFQKKLISVEPGERLEAAARLMATAGVKKLPVMEGTRLVGIVTQTDVVNASFALVTSLKEMVQARYRPPDFEM